jgi:hypothetical protein
MRVVWRAALVLVVFVGVGLLVSHGVMLHVRAERTPAADVRPAAWMAGLFAGGLAAVVTGIAVLLKR